MSARIHEFPKQPGPSSILDFFDMFGSLGMSNPGNAANGMSAVTELLSCFFSQPQPGPVEFTERAAFGIYLLLQNIQAGTEELARRM